MTVCTVSFYLHSMRTIAGFAVLVIILCNVPALSAQEKLSDNYVFSLCSQYGIFFGYAEEIVYPDSSRKAEILSQLLWDINPVCYFGLQLDFSRREPLKKWGLFSNLSFKFGLPAFCGKMEDRDWQSIENTALTAYSIHDNFTREFFQLELSAGFSYPLFRVLLLNTFLNMSFMRFCFFGMDGYGIYANRLSEGKYDPIDFSGARHPYSGKVINYTQEWMIVAPGVSLCWYLPKNFQAELSFSASPLILCADMDEHLTTNTQYRDYMQGGLYLEPGIRLSYSMYKWMDISFEFSWRYISGSTGLIYSTNYGSGYYVPGGKAGAGLSMTDTSLLFTTRM